MAAIHPASFSAAPSISPICLRVLCIAGLVLLLTASDGGAQEAKVDFESQVAPILQQHCLQCHSPGIAKGDLSLATVDHLVANGFLEPGKPQASYLLEVIEPQNGQPAWMPKDAPPVPPAQRDLIRRWIEQGANWPEAVVVREKPKADASFWSLQPLAKPTKPSIDDFIAAKLKENGMKLRPMADRRTLIRRATYDLTGLPPTPAQVESFLVDPASDEAAFAKLVDRLLESPHYGERWGRHWLDVVRFGESNGFERNVLIHSLWPFRDYVIDSINQDKPFSQLIREHLAGDVIAPGQFEVAVGSAFLVAGPYDDVGNQDAAQAAQIRANTIDEIIGTTGQAFLGMTIGCARCHDHKFDPITQEDYYAFYATFSGVRHGDVTIATPEQQSKREQSLKPLNEKKQQLEQARHQANQTILDRGRALLEQEREKWTRDPVDRRGTEESFAPVEAKYVRLISELQDIHFRSGNGFRIDEFEIYAEDLALSDDLAKEPRNVALASHGSRATGKARVIKDFPQAYGAHLAIDGKSGERFISTADRLTVELPQPIRINRIVFSSAKHETTPAHTKFAFVAEYRIEVSLDGETWTEIANGRDRKPVNETSHLNYRIKRIGLADSETHAARQQLNEIQPQLNEVNAAINQIPPLRRAWIGKRVEADARGPFHVFVGGSPQRKGATVLPASLSAVGGDQQPSYSLAKSSESERRLALANWITDDSNPLTPRVLANRLWHYHFGTGIVATPSDFGYMGGRPSHPELLDFLASKLIEHQWRWKPMHRLIMNSEVYRQASTSDPEAASIDLEARLLWRFPPRRLSAEEIRDTFLQVSGKLNPQRGGPGFRLYEYLQDNVSTYVPLDQHGPETFRRAVYHQNARAAVVDLMTEFDQPDCAFSAPRRAETTTPLQALTMFNHRFTLDMAEALAQRLQDEAGPKSEAQIRRAFQLCYSRMPDKQEIDRCQQMVQQHGMASLCRVLLNTSELIYVH